LLSARPKTRSRRFIRGVALRLEEDFKNMFLVFGPDSDAGVRHAELDFTGGAAYFDRDDTAARGEFNRV